MDAVSSCALIAKIVAYPAPQNYWYLDLGVASEAATSRLLFDPSHRWIVGLLNFLTLVTLYSTVIPISLYVSIELVKYFQAHIILLFLFRKKQAGMLYIVQL